MLTMIAVIFEVEPADRDAYFRIARELRPLLETIDGFISIERFQSLNNEHRILSLSFWRDEAAVAAWRNTEDHRAAQSAGRGGVFNDYRLRVAHVMRDYGMSERAEVPTDSAAVHALPGRSPGESRGAIRDPVADTDMFAPGSRLGASRDA